MKFALGAAAAITGASALIYLLLRPRKRRLDPGKRKPAAPYAAAAPSCEEHGKVSGQGNAELPAKSGDDAALHNLNGHVSLENSSAGSESPNASVRKAENEKLRGSVGVEKDFSLDDDSQKQRCPSVEKDFSLDDEFHARQERSDELSRVASSPVSDISAKPDVANDSVHLLKESRVTADIVEDRTLIPSLEDIAATSCFAVEPEISKTCQVEVSQEKRLHLESLDKPECDQVDGNTAVGLEAASAFESTAPLTESTPEAIAPIPSIPEQVTSLSSDIQCGEPLSNHGESFEGRQTVHSDDPAETNFTNVDGSLATADCDSGIYVSCDNQNSSSRLLEESKLDEKLEPVAVDDVKEGNESTMPHDDVSLVDEGQISFEPVESAAHKLSREADTLTGQPEVRVSQSDIQNSSVSEEKSVSVLAAELGESDVLSQGCEVVLETCKADSAPEFSSEVTNSLDACKKDLPGLPPLETVSSSTCATMSEDPVAKEGLVEDHVQVSEKTAVSEQNIAHEEIAKKEICVSSKAAATEVSPVNSKENQEDKPEVVTIGKVSESQDVDAKKQSKPGVSVGAADSDQNKSQVKTAAPKKEEARKAKGTDSKAPSARTTKESSPSSESGPGGRRSYKGRTRNPVGSPVSSANEEPLVPKENEDQAKNELCSSVEDPAAIKDKSATESSWRTPNTKPNKDHAAVSGAKESNKTAKDSNKTPKAKKESVDCSKNKSYKERVRNTQGSEQNRKSESEDRTLDNNDRNLRSNESSQSSIGEVEPETLFNPSAFPVTSQETYIFYEFEIPQVLVGRLIGRKGAFVNKIKAATDASIIVGPHRNRRFKMCSVEGTKSQVEAALDMIREYFPINRYPELTLAQVHSRSPALPPVHGVINNQAMQIELAMGVVVEVRVSAVASGNEIWVQQPLHPSFSALQRLQACMNLNYGDGSTTPQIPGPIPERTVCVAQIDTQWYRCQVLSATEETVLVVLLDVGGALTVPASSLRQIRRDYATLPFQATQCLLHGIQPISEEGWDDTSTAFLEELVSGVIMSATVVSYMPDGVPLVNLYRCDQDELIFVNERLVTSGHARWIPLTPSS